MHQLIDKKIKLFFYFFLFLLLSTQISINNNQKDNFYTSLNIIEVEGLSDKNNLTVYQNLKFLLSKNIFFINKNDIHKIVKKNNLVESFYIKKFYPNLIKVKINQTKLLAITNKNNEKFFIGSNGKLISTDQIENFNEKLPFVYTNRNYFDFIELKKIIDKSKFKFEEIESFFYFPSNRWDIKTKDGFLIKLPKKKIKESLIFAEYIKTNEKFKDRKIIDLRISDNIILSNE